MNQPVKDKQFVNEHISQAITNCFYGEIKVKFEHGRVVQIVKEQSFKPPKN